MNIPLFGPWLKWIRSVCQIFCEIGCGWISTLQWELSPNRTIKSVVDKIDVELVIKLRPTVSVTKWSRNSSHFNSYFYSVDLALDMWTWRNSLIRYWTRLMQSNLTQSAICPRAANSNLLSTAILTSPGAGFWFILYARIKCYTFQ